MDIMFLDEQLFGNPIREQYCACGDCLEPIDTKVEQVVVLPNGIMLRRSCYLKMDEVERTAFKLANKR